MGDTTVKDAAIELIQELPDEATWDDLIYHRYVRQKIELGLEAAEQGKLVSQEEVRRRFGFE